MNKLNIFQKIKEVKMKKKILILMVGLLLMGVNAFAGGDVIVNGNVGVGNTSPTYPLDVLTTDKAAMINLDGTVTQTGLKKGVQLFFDFTGASINPNVRGAFYLVRSQGSGSTGGVIGGFNGNANYESEGRLDVLVGADNTVNINTSMAGTTYAITDAIGNSVELRKGSSNSQAVAITNYYGFYSMGNSAGGGSISAVNGRHAYFTNFPNYSGTFSDVTGLWIDKQTRGVNNYGIVLNGDGTGADIVFGPAQSARIYSSAGELFAKDGAGNVTQISPHDPETGEWVFYSKNLKTGRVVRVNMEKLVKAVEKLTGETFLVETFTEEN